ncbi:MAG: sugar-binding domain-containing protein [Chloroflexota bacterium]
MMDEAHHELLAEVAALYYEQDMTQNAIAKQIGLSRVKVYRLLKEAREQDVVRININYPIARDAHLEASLVETFNLKDAVVLNPVTQTNSLQRLGVATARYLERQLANYTRLAICPGRSTYEAINAIRSDFLSDLQVTQAIGSLPYDMYEYDSTVLTRQLAQKLGGEAMYLTSPVMADSAEAAVVIRSQRDVQRALLAASQSDVALVGIGNLDPATSGFVTANFLEPQELDEMRKDGAIGDIAMQMFRVDGSMYPCALNERVIGITFDELRGIPLTIAMAMGVEKARAILGSIRSGVIDVLCTDNRTAAQVIELN